MTWLAWLAVVAAGVVMLTIARLLTIYLVALILVHMVDKWRTERGAGTETEPLADRLRKHDR